MSEFKELHFKLLKGVLKLENVNRINNHFLKIIEHNKEKLFNISELKSEFLNAGLTKGSCIPHDYTYNRWNDGDLTKTKINKLKRNSLFEYDVDTEYYRFLGFNAPICSPILDKERKIVGEWKSGELNMFETVNPTNMDGILITKPVFTRNSPLNQILFGPPGTGKTYNTVEAAVKAALPSYDSQNRSDWKFQFDSLSEAGRIRFVTFHQSYGYEEFVQGLRAETRDGQIHYEVRSGIFKQMCEDAANDPDNNYVLVIDEINRGNISKIFGELITLIEDTKRKDVTNTDEYSESLSVRLPYSTPDETDFFVPSNLFIIGTMNTADRSLAAMDTALRRRFHFTEMMPDPSVFTVEGVNVVGVDLVQMLTVMNRRIEFLYDREHTLGHAFFMSIKNSDDPFYELKSILKNKIIPLLEEYFFEDWEKIQLVLGDNQKPSACQFITEEKAFDAKSLFGGKYANDLNIEPQKHFKLNEGAFDLVNAYVGIYKAQYSSDETDISFANDSVDAA